MASPLNAGFGPNPYDAAGRSKHGATVAGSIPSPGPSSPEESVHINFSAGGPIQLESPDSPRTSFGTGLASPAVAGWAAQKLAENPHLPVSELKAAVISHFSPVNNCPTTLSMDEMQGVGLPQGNSNTSPTEWTHGILSASGQGFEGLNGTKYRFAP